MVIDNPQLFLSLGINETLIEIFEDLDVDLEDLRETVQTLEESFDLLSQKWNLQILYILLFRNKMRFSELKKTLEVNSRTLSDKLKSLSQNDYVDRTIEEGPILVVRYFLTKRGKNTILLALPLLYYFNSDLARMNYIRIFFAKKRFVLVSI